MVTAAATEVTAAWEVMVQTALRAAVPSLLGLDAIADPVGVDPAEMQAQAAAAVGQQTAATLDPSFSLPPVRLFLFCRDQRSAQKAVTTDIMDIPVNRDDQEVVDLPEMARQVATPSLQGMDLMGTFRQTVRTLKEMLKWVRMQLASLRLS